MWIPGNRLAGRISKHRRGPPLRSAGAAAFGLLLTGGHRLPAFSPPRPTRRSSSDEQTPRSRAFRSLLRSATARMARACTEDGKPKLGPSWSAPGAAADRLCRHRPDAAVQPQRAGAAEAATFDDEGRRPRWRRTSPRSAPAPRSPGRGRLQPRGHVRRRSARRPPAAGSDLSGPTAPPATTSRGSGPPAGGYAPEDPRRGAQVHLRGTADRDRRTCRNFSNGNLSLRRSATSPPPRLAGRDAELLAAGPAASVRSRNGLSPVPVGWSASLPGSPPTAPARPRRRWTRERTRAASSMNLPDEGHRRPLPQPGLPEHEPGVPPTSTRRWEKRAGASGRHPDGRRRRSARSCCWSPTSASTPDATCRPRRPEPARGSPGRRPAVHRPASSSGRKLMVDHEILPRCHPAASLPGRRPPSPRSTLALEESGIGRRPLVRNHAAARSARPPGDRDAAATLGPTPGQVADAQEPPRRRA